FGEPTITRHNNVDAPPPNSPCGQRFGAAPPSTWPPPPNGLSFAGGHATAPDSAPRPHESQRPAPSPDASAPRQSVDGAEVFLCRIGGAVLRLADHDRGAVPGP